MTVWTKATDFAAAHFVTSFCSALAGTNFPRIGMQRIRRVADAAAAVSPRQLTPLLDLHTGEDPSPPAVSYASHYPMIDYVSQRGGAQPPRVPVGLGSRAVCLAVQIWNGEGFDFSGSPAYWLVELSSRIHGLSGDMLGGGPGSAFRGMLYGMTAR